MMILIRQVLSAVVKKFLFFCGKFALLQFYDLMHCTLCSSITCLSEDHNKKPVISSFFCFLNQKRQLWPPSVCPTLKNWKAHSSFFSFSQFFYFVKTGNASFDLDEREILFHFLSLQISCLAASSARQILEEKKCVHFFRLCRFPFLLLYKFAKKVKKKKRKG